MKGIDEASYLAYTAGWATVRKMPERAAYETFNKIADRLWKRRGKGVQRLEANLARVVPDADADELRQLSREGMRRYFRYWCDAFRMPDWSSERVVESFRLENQQWLKQAMTAGRGGIVALPHMGNWDHAGGYATLSVAPVTAVAERLKPERLFDRFVEYRESLGMQILPVGMPGLIDELARQLTDENRVVALVADRDLSRRAVPVTLFGEPTRMPAGPATLALRTSAPLFAAALWYDGPIAVARLSRPIQIPAGAPTGPGCWEKPGFDEALREITQQVADYFEAGIREHPVDWHMLQHLWLADLDPDRLAAADAAADAGDQGPED